MPKIYVEVTRQIERLIERGVLKSGDRLPSEPELANQLGISRPPLREALSALEVLGIIERKGRTGSFVKANINTVRFRHELRQLGRNVSPFQAYQARKLVETEIAQLAVETATEKDIAAVKKAFQQMEKQARRTNSSLTWQAINRCDIDFHLSLAEATHNALLVDMVRYMMAGLGEELWAKMKARHVNFRQRLRETLLEHKQILDAVTRKDGSMVRKKLCKHLQKAEREMFGRA